MELSGKGISPKHALLFQGIRGELRVMDLRSELGTYLGEFCVIDSSIGPGTMFRIANHAILVESFEADTHGLGANLSALRRETSGAGSAARFYTPPEASFSGNAGDGVAPVMPCVQGKKP